MHACHILGYLVSPLISIVAATGTRAASSQLDRSERVADGDVVPDTEDEEGGEEDEEAADGEGDGDAAVAGHAARLL